MLLTLNTTASNGQLILYIINSNGAKILTLKNNDHGTCLLVPGYTYRMEWHTWSPDSADYHIDAGVDSANPGFPPFVFDKSYDGPSSDLGGFYFII
jgi:hypothetical protein